MPATANAPHAQFVQEIRGLMNSTSAIADHLKALTTSFHTVVSTSPEATVDLLESSTQLSQSLVSSTKTLQDCLRDLATMGEAMMPVMESNPEASPDLIVNLYSTFFRQLKAYYRDATDNFAKCSTVFEQGRAAFYKERFTTSTAAAAADPVRSLPNTPRHPAASSSTAQPPPADVSATDAPAKKKKKQKVNLEDELGEPALNANALEDAGAGRAKKRRGDASTSASADGGTDSGAAPTFEVQATHEDPEIAALAAAAAVGGAQKSRRAKAQKMLEDGGDAVQRLAAPPSSSSSVRPSNEPAYLIVTTSVEDSLGRLIRSSRPNVFSTADAFLRRPPLAIYYIRLVRPGSLAFFVVKNYINVDEDSQADLFCDVLDTDTVEVEPVESTSGEVIVVDETNLRDLPVCGWRVGSNESHTRLLHTTYVLVEQPSVVLGRSAIVQDSFVVDGSREEVMHSVTLIDVAPQFAKVTVYSLSGRLNASESKIDAIVALTRNNFHNSGFNEVDESDVLAAVPKSKQDSNTELQALRSVSTSSIAPTDAFQPPVQLASLDEPARLARQNRTMGEVTRGVLRGGVEVLRAPLTVGRMVGGAVLDVTGATEAIRNSVESIFRKTFPDLVKEPILDSFNCAWEEGSVLKQGYLFITKHWLCFAGSVTNAEFSMEYDEIKDVQKSRSSMFDNAIRITTHLNEQFFLMNFVNRDQAFTTLMQQWLK